jgi:hypothetical protein
LGNKKRAVTMDDALIQPKLGGFVGHGVVDKHAWQAGLA